VSSSFCWQDDEKHEKTFTQVDNRSDQNVIEISRQFCEPSSIPAKNKALPIDGSPAQTGQTVVELENASTSRQFSQAAANQRLEECRFFWKFFLKGIYVCEEKCTSSLTRCGRFSYNMAVYAKLVRPTISKSAALLLFNPWTAVLYLPIHEHVQIYFLYF